LAVLKGQVKQTLILYIVNFYFIYCLIELQIYDILQYEKYALIFLKERTFLKEVGKINKI